MSQCAYGRGSCSWMQQGLIGDTFSPVVFFGLSVIGGHEKPLAPKASLSITRNSSSSEGMTHLLACTPQSYCPVTELSSLLIFFTASDMDPHGFIYGLLPRELSSPPVSQAREHRLPSALRSTQMQIWPTTKFSTFKLT